MFGRNKGATYKVADEKRRGSLGDGEVLGSFRRMGSIAQNDAPLLNLLQIRNGSHENSRSDISNDIQIAETENTSDKLKVQMKELSTSLSDLRLVGPRKSESDIFPGGKAPKSLRQVMFRTKSEEVPAGSSDDEHISGFFGQVKSKIRRNSHIKEEEVIEDIFGFLHHVEGEKDEKTVSLGLSGLQDELSTRAGAGYLSYFEHKGHGRAWHTFYCRYDKDNRSFFMVPYSETKGKITNAETFQMKSRCKRDSLTLEKRYCFDVISADGTCRTFSADSEEERRCWISAMADDDEYRVEFIDRILSVLESRGLEDTGIYRIGGVKTKYMKMLQQAEQMQALESLQMEGEETQTLTSCLKIYINNFPGSLITGELRNQFLQLVNIRSNEKKNQEMDKLISQLPKHNKAVLTKLLQHLKKVAEKSSINKMTASNLGTVWGQNLLSSGDATEDAANIKYSIEVVKILIENSLTDYTKQLPTQLENQVPILAHDGHFSAD